MRAWRTWYCKARLHPSAYNVSDPIALLEPMNYNHQHYRARRAQLISEMRRQTGGGIAAIPTSPEAVRNADTHYPYRPDSHFYYLSGFSEPEAVALLLAGREEGDSKHILFCRDQSAEREIWDGFRYRPRAARESCAFD